MPWTSPRDIKGGMPWTSPRDIKKQNNFFSYPLFSFFFLIFANRINNANLRT